VRDPRHAVRRLVRDWRFTAAAVVILGLGIGANTAIFSLINAMLFRGQSLADPDRLVDIYQNASNPGGIDGNSYPAYLDMAAYTDVFASTTAALVPRGVHYQDEVLRSAVAEHTTATYLSVLGLRPSLGRWFNAAEDTPGAAVVAVVGHEAWTRKFRADPSVIGRTIRIEGVPVTIVGVGPAGHRGTINVGIVTDFWLPISSLPAFGVPSRTLERRPEEAAFFVKARLRDGVTVAQAHAAMRILGTRLASEYPKEDPGKGIAVFALSDVRIHPQMDGLLAAIASLLLVVVGLVLAIACSNLATLLLVRGTARAKEVSVRLALGATRGQLVRHLLTESLLLSLAGGITKDRRSYDLDLNTTHLRGTDEPVAEIVQCGEPTSLREVGSAGGLELTPRLAFARLERGRTPPGASPASSPPRAMSPTRTRSSRSSGSSRCTPGADRVEHRRADDDRSARDHHRREPTDVHGHGADPRRLIGTPFKD